MGHGHGHGHAHDSGSAGLLRWVLAANLIFFVVELSAGLWSSSLALVSDAGHALGDSGALFLALVADVISRQPATRRASFGLVRARVLGAFLNGLALAAIGGGVLTEAVQRVIQAPPPPPAGIVIGVGLAGLVLNLGSAALLARGRRDLNIRGALTHVLVDALGSAAAVAAGVALSLGFTRADSVVALVMAALVLRVAWLLLRDAASVLLEVAPSGVDPDRVREVLTAVPGVLDVHDLHVWSLDGEHALVSVHLRTAASDAFAPVQSAAHQALERLHVHHRTLQVEVDCSGGCTPN